MELLNIYDDNGNKTGRIIERGDKSVKLSKNEHIAISVIFIENDNGEFLIQKTSKEKGNIYSSTGGHVDSCETPITAIKREVKEELGIDISNDLIEEYGEACKTPKEMAEEQHRLEETAEKVMKNMLVEKDVTSIDVRGMKLVMTQIQALGKMGEQSETYNIPILVEDKLGNLSLKIVRGTEEKGLVDVALHMDESGVISGSFRYEHGEITGDVDFEKQEMAGLFSEHMPYFANAMREATGLPVSFRYGTDASIAVDDFYEEKDVDFAVTKEQDPIATKVLYGIARSFVEEMGELLS